MLFPTAVEKVLDVFYDSIETNGLLFLYKGWVVIDELFITGVISAKELGEWVVSRKLGLS